MAKLKTQNTSDKTFIYEKYLKVILKKRAKTIYQADTKIRYRVITINPETGETSSYITRRLPQLKTTKVARIRLKTKVPSRPSLANRTTQKIVSLPKNIFRLIKKIPSAILAFIYWFDSYEVELGWPDFKKWQKKLKPNKRYQKSKKTKSKKKLKKRSQTRFNYLTQILIFSSMMLMLLAGVIWFYQFAFFDLPPAEELVKKTPPVSSKILDRNGKVLYKIYDDENRTLVSLDQISPAMIYATIAIEDQNFYHHFGFDPEGIIRAAIANWQGKPIQGGSTITQQLVKNRLLSPERTIQRKIKELILAVAVERKFSKEEILEMYLNQVAYGGSTYGVEEAAQKYFGKHASQLNLAEAALLAGLPQAPSVYSPFGPNPDLTFKRQKEVLRRMVDEGYISLEQAREAANKPISFRVNTTDIKAPHFVFYVKDLLAKKYGEEMLARGGLQVTTSLDLKLQDKTQETVSQELEKLKRLHINNGAALVTNPSTGEVLAMVGSKDYFDFQNDGQVNVVLRPRQPGSSIKPLTYALAFSRGYKPSDKILDAPITYDIKGSKPYSPKNYDGKYHGLVTLREALASSYNIPATKLLNQLGVDNLINFAQKMGITTWNDRNRFGLSLTLGGGEVRMIDLAQAYSVFADLGKKVPINPILEVKDATGKVIYRNPCVYNPKKCPAQRVLRPGVAYEITHVLKDNQARTPAFGPMSVLYIPDQEVAVKTGTTNSMRDNWTVGYTTDRLVAVWVGNNDNSPMSHVASGITGASPIWNKIMRSLLNPKNPHAFAVPKDVIVTKICSLTNTLPCPGCPSLKEEVFLKGSEPKQSCVFIGEKQKTSPSPKAE